MRGAMKRILLLLLLSGIGFGQSIPTTPNLGLQLIPDGYQNWGVPYRQTMNTIDTWSATIPITAAQINAVLATLPNCPNINYYFSPASVGCFTIPVQSVFGRGGTVTAQNGDYATFYDSIGAAAAAQAAAEVFSADASNLSNGTINLSLISGLSLANIAAGASPTGLFDFSPATQLKLPIRAGYTAAAAGEIGYDSTNGNVHFNFSGTDLIAAGFPSASLPTSGHCAQFTEIGNWWEITDAGAACGSGGGGGGTVTSISIAAANGISGSSSGGATPVLTLALGAITPTSVSVSGSGIPIATGVSSNTDLAGQITLSSGTGTYTFTATYAMAPICIATDTTAAAAVKSSATTTLLTLTGTGTDVINYICIGRT